jgi:hypothetical protein
MSRLAVWPQSPPPPAHLPTIQWVGKTLSPG